MNNRIGETIRNLEKNNIHCIYVERKEEVLEKLDSLIKDQTIVGIGGSQTLFECGVIDYLRNRNINFLDRYKDNLTQEERKEIFRKSFFSDVYLTSTNAITEDGYLYNVDGRGNRVAAMIYGPDKVIVVSGVNKIVDNVEKAVERVEKIAGPLNAKRLYKNTPCVKSNECMHCHRDDKICRDFVLIKHPLPNRITVILVNEHLGF